MVRVHILVSLFLVFAAATADATVQFSDSIVIDGAREQLVSEPLVSFLNAHPDRAAAFQKLTRPGCTASDRGYMARWMIKAEALWLTELASDPCGASMAIPLTSLFPDAKGAVHATWFSGELLLPRGQKLGKYIQQYEKYLVITVERGKILKTEIRKPVTTSRH